MRIGNQRPRLSQLPAKRVGSAGPDACEFAQTLGYDLDDWQQWVIDGMLSEDQYVRLCAAVICLIVSRQNGKNVILEVIELYAFFVLGWDMIYHTAHLQDTAASHMASMQAVVEANPGLDEITVFSTANGKERMTRVDTGAMIRFITRGKKAGRGPSPKMVVFDEALYTTDDQIKALIPGMSAQSMNEDPPLMVFTSSAPVEESRVLHRTRNAFIAGKLEGFFAEWSAHVEEGQTIDITDVDIWYDTNPGMGIRIDPDWVRTNELALLDPIDFMGERLGVPIGGGDQAGSGAINVSDWTACLDMESEIDDGQPSALALAVGPGAVWSTFSEAGKREDGDMHGEVIVREPGTRWVVAKALELTQRLDCSLIVDPKSPTSGVIQKLVDAGVPLIYVDLADYMEACSIVQIAVQNRTLHHISQPPLNSAVIGAEIRPIGEAWVWSQKSSDVDITSLVSLTLAVGQASKTVEDSGELWMSMT